MVQKPTSVKTVSVKSVPPFEIRQIEKHRYNQHTISQPWDRRGKVLTIRFNELACGSSDSNSKLIKELKGIADEHHVSLNQLVIQMCQYCVEQIKCTK